ncbi:MAG: FhaA domain-containing protein [Acidimicrobiales bacterium]
MGVLVLVLLGLGGAAAWLRWAGAADGARDWAKDTLATLYPSRPSSRRLLPRRLLRAAEQTLTVGVSGTVLVPTDIEIRVNPADVEPFAEATDWLAHDIADALRKKAATRGWVIPDGPHVVILEDPDRPMRVPRAVGRIKALSPQDVATMRPADAGPLSGEVEPTLPATSATSFAPTMRAWHLRLVSSGTGDDDMSAVLTSTQPLVLGRSRQADLRVGDPQASARHCTFALGADDTVVVEDLGSTNGTYVGTHRVDRVSLHHGDTLRIGAAAWRVELSDVAAGSPT